MKDLTLKIGVGVDGNEYWRGGVRNGKGYDVFVEGVGMTKKAERMYGGG